MAPGIKPNKKGNSLSSLENDKFIESKDYPGCYGVFVVNGDGSSIGGATSLDGALDGGEVVNGDLGSGETTYTYFDMARSGWKHFTAICQLEATILTIEASNSQPAGNNTDPIEGATIPADAMTSPATATNTDGTGLTLIATELQDIGNGDDALNGLTVEIVADTTTPGNVGEKRLITDYTAATGTITVGTAFGAITSGVTQFKVTDTDDTLVSPTYGKVLVSDATAFWADVTESIAHIATLTDPVEVVIADTALTFTRMRFKKVTTNATNSAIIELTRGR